MTYLFIRLLKDDLKEYTYAARLSGLSYGIASGMNAILVSKMQTKEKAPHRFKHYVELGKTINFCIFKQEDWWFFPCTFLMIEELKLVLATLMNDLVEFSASCEHVCALHLHACSSAWNV